MQLKILLRPLQKYKVNGSLTAQVGGISQNSRDIKKNYLFVAIKGINHDGHDFIEDAINRGASVVVGEKNLKLKIAYIKVPDAREALGRLSSEFYGNPSSRLNIIGVTGTDGKTTTANLIYWILKSTGKKIGLISTLGAIVGEKTIDTGLHVTNPDPINLQKFLSQMVEEGCNYAVVEVTSHGLVQKRVSAVKFDVGVLTNITHEHLDYHKTFDEYLTAKSKLFTNTRIAILNKKDSSFDRVKSLIPRSVKIIGYPLAVSKPIIKAINKRFPEDYNKLNAKAAIAVAKIYGVEEKELFKAITTFPQLEGRMEEIRTKRGFRVFIDFAHTPNALENALGALRRKLFGGGKLIAIFGSAGERDAKKRPMMGGISTKLADFSVITSEDPRGEEANSIIDQIARGMTRGRKKGSAKFYKIEDREEAIDFAINKLANKGDIVGVFGKGHEKSMAYGDSEHPWSDKEAVRMALRRKVDKIKSGLDFDRMKFVHFTGIKGVGMASLALCFDDMGIKVSGSDTKELFVTDEILEQRNIKWKIGFSGHNIDARCDLLIATGAHGGLNNPEVFEANKRGIPVMTHAEALAKIAHGKDTIATCGVGGKSTTASIIAVILNSAGLKPSFAIGVGRISPLNTPGRFNRQGKHFICEADEFAISPGVNNKPRFSLLTPKILVTTNIEYDHPDIYPTLSDTKRVFNEFIQKVPSDGWLVACADNVNTKDVISKLNVPKVTYGFTSDADWQISGAIYSSGHTKFSLKHNDEVVKDIRINIPGRYNVLNATAAFIVATCLGISSTVAKKGLVAFSGVRRRFEFIGEFAGVKFYDDYAHHPLEIRAVLAAARQWFPDSRIVAVFQPHTYSRTRFLFKEFVKSFEKADIVALMDIYSSAREKKDPNISSQKLVREIKKYSKESYYLGGHNKAVVWIKHNIKKGDILLTLGAGDIFYLHKLLFKK